PPAATPPDIAQSPRSALVPPQGRCHFSGTNNSRPVPSPLPTPETLDMMGRRRVAARTQPRTARRAPLLWTYMRGAAVVVVTLRRRSARCWCARLASHPYLGARGAAREV